MHFDWTISIGNLLTAAALFLGFVAAHFQNIRRLDSIESRVKMMYDWFQRKVIYREENGR